MPTCPHGDPHPQRCALCRQETLFPVGRKTPRTYAVETVWPVPRPAWFDSVVEQAREQARRERER